MSMHVMDTVMVGQLSSNHLAGIVLGVSTFFPLLMLFTGVLMGITPIIAQLDGAGRRSECGEVARQGIWLVVAGSVMMTLLLSGAEPFYRFVGVDEAAIPVTAEYLAAYSYGVPALLLYFLIRHFCEGLGRTKPAMFVVAAALPLKFLLNYALIYGNWGAPALGGAGCGWATAIVAWFECVAMFVIVSRPYYRNTGVLRNWPKPNLALIAQINRVGLPIGLTQFMESAFFSFVAILIGTLGGTALAAHGVAANFNGVTFTLPIALGVASSIRVGNLVGANDRSGARQACRAAIQIALIFALFAFIALALSREWIASLYTQDPEVIALAAGLLLIVAAYQFVDDTQVVMLGALRGYKDTKVPMLIALFGYWIVALPVGCILGLGWGVESIGAYGFWVALSVGLSLVALLLGVRLHRHYSIWSD